MIAPGAELTTAEEFKILEKTIKHLKKTKKVGLRFKKLNLDTVKVVVLTDASFVNSRGLRCLLGLFMLLTDGDGISNIIHFGSSRCNRVPRSVMASDFHALVLKFDHASVIRKTLNELLRIKVPLKEYVNSKIDVDVGAKYGNTTKKRFQTYLNELHESYTRGEFSTLGWIPGGRKRSRHMF